MANFTAFQSLTGNALLFGSWRTKNFSVTSLDEQPFVKMFSTARSLNWGFSDPLARSDFSGSFPSTARSYSSGSFSSTARFCLMGSFRTEARSLSWGFSRARARSISKTPTDQSHHVLQSAR